MPSILQPWVETLGLRHQGVLMSAMRGCDVAPRHDPSKIAQRALRAAVLVPHSGRFANPATYITIPRNVDHFLEMVEPFIKSCDHYPHHYVMHFTHAAEIIGYHGPTSSPTYSHQWWDIYTEICRRLHLHAETKAELEARLNADEETFARLQRDR